MILFHKIVEIGVGSMENITTKRFADGARVGVMPISRHSLWGMTNRLKWLSEKSFRRIHVPFLAQHRVNQVPITIDGAVQITPLPMHACP
jgi:hypothetical protein